MKKILPIILVFLLILQTGCVNQKNIGELNTRPPKYVFLFIGDGMGWPQITAYANYMGTMEADFIGTLANPTPENPPVPLFPSFTRFPEMGIAATQDASKFIADSASAATAIASGVITLDGALGMDAFGNPVPSIAELLRDQKNYKIGLVSSVSIDHATPSAFYSHLLNRRNYYDIALDLIASGFDYFGGGGFRLPYGMDGDMPGILEQMEEAGYTVANTYEDIAALGSDSGKVIAIAPVLDNDRGDAALLYTIDRSEDDMSLSDFVRIGIDVLHGEQGFFMMVEGGKLDWACHGNDAATMIMEIHDFYSAVGVAVEFAEKYPDETLIIVTGDHETGGLSNGFNLTGYDTYMNLLSYQKISLTRFAIHYILPWRSAQTSFEEAMQSVETLFGLTLPQNASDETEPLLILSPREIEMLREAYDLSMIPFKERVYDSEEYLAEYSYYWYEPFQLAVTRILNNKAGLAWTSTSHTALPVPVFAKGMGAEHFSGFYDNIEIFHKLVAILGLEN